MEAFQSEASDLRKIEFIRNPDYEQGMASSFNTRYTKDKKLIRLRIITIVNNIVHKSRKDERLHKFPFRLGNLSGAFSFLLCIKNARVS